MSIVGHQMHTSTKWKTILFKIGRKDTFTFTNPLKYSQEIISKCQWSPEFTTTCTAQCMLQTYSHSQESLSPCQTIRSALIWLRESASGTPLKKPSDKISTPHKKLFGRLKDRPLLFQYTLHSTNSTCKQEGGIALTCKRDFGKLKDMHEVWETLLTLSQDCSDNPSNWKHFGCLWSCLKFSSCQDSCHGSLCPWLIKQKFSTCIPKPRLSWFRTKPLDGCLIS